MGSIGLSFSESLADDRPRSLTSAVQERLRADILSTRLLPGQKLHIAGLAKQFSVSLAAVREALSRLVADGLVQASDQRGFRVSPVSPADLRDVTQTRTDIEGLALRRSIDRRSANPSISTRVWVTSRRSAGDTGLTRKPRWSDACTNPSATSRDNASRTAARLTENCLASPAM